MGDLPKEKSYEAGLGEVPWGEAEVLNELPVRMGLAVDQQWAVVDWRMAMLQH